MEKKSIYKYASEAGLPAGLYLTLMSACVLFSINFPPLPMLLFPLGIGFPFLLWFLIRKISREEASYNKFSSLWLGGIYTVIFGTLICLFLSALYIVFIQPDFVAIYVNNALEAVESSPMAADYAESIEMMHKAIEAHILPSGMEFLTTMAWFTCFCGSVLSAVIALIINYRTKNIAGQYQA